MSKTHIWASLGLGVSAGVLWAAARMPWLIVSATDDLAGQQVAPLTGVQWAAEIQAVVFVLLAGSIACVALRRLGRRIVGGLVALVAALAALSPVALFSSAPDATRVQNILSSASASGHLTDTAALNSWAQISHIEVQAFPLALALISCAFAVFFGSIIAIRPGNDSVHRNQYERVTQRVEKIHHDLAQEPDSGRVLWDALDNDIDPTQDH
ncbi:hypothetical membrane protein [Corynebacterium kutscheri]|uniref:Hypothetical membrane protein n=1 Tax=Corynebacterium kutscheri TaxID=35755 RepID=A0A0F6R046_9CORY|nr:TIGR02234 family membrane protein [Corynebacterium kutscheri]AKE41512.1 trp region conserved hypothetical membrane protein [Corynebacterium kutscheri]VEH08790.1 hypothetical membrane protein [Corynebacterium kutscheri]VEH09836.1 hypothetical membrane protein [Corynebacterium kutscheri]VEH79919.1 hypothetical membrane protein [Corynebacterium kutscheri]